MKKIVYSIICVLILLLIGLMFLLDLNKGDTVLNGNQAVGYLRYRKDGLGDIGRTQRQQWFMRSLFEKLHSPQVITKIPEVLNICNTYIKKS